jgi:membrane-bound lytic murein transglycosylase D
VDLDILAETAGMNREELRTMNRELHYNITPPDARHYLKVRSAHEETVRETLARTEQPLIRFYFHTVQYGDTLSALARHYGVPVAQISAANPGIQPRYLKLGARLRIPALKETRAPAGPDRTERAGGAPVFAGTHGVRRGETRWSIALT